MCSKAVNNSRNTKSTSDCCAENLMLIILRTCEQLVKYVDRGLSTSDIDTHSVFLVECNDPAVLWV